MMTDNRDNLHIINTKFTHYILTVEDAFNYNDDGTIEYAFNRIAAEDE